MTVNRGYASNHKFYDDMGRITPNVDWSESHRPHFEAQVASWLPVVRYEQEIRSWFVVSAGKIASVDRERNIVLSGYKKAWIPGAANVLTYTTDDVSAGTIDLTTGSAVASAVQYSETQITTALRARGLIKETERAMDFISHPIGYASYNFYQAAGTDVRNPATYTYHNFKPQELVAVTCDYVMVAPLTPAAAATETMANDNTAGADTALSTNGFGVKGWYNSTQINDSDRFASSIAADADIVCYVFDNYPVARNTGSTPITSDVTGGLVEEKNSVSAVTAAGDFYIDYAVGILFLYEEGGNAIPTGWSVSSTVDYFHYASAAGSAQVSSYFCATGDIKEGDLVTYDANSNLIKAELDIANAMGYNGSGNAYTTDPDYDTAADADISLQLEQAVANYESGIIGQVLNSIDYPRDYLDRVRTAYEGSVSTPNPLTGIPTQASMQTPGSATGGRSDQLTYTNSADKVLIVNFIKR